MVHFPSQALQVNKLLVSIRLEFHDLLLQCAPLIVMPTISDVHLVVKVSRFVVGELPQVMALVHTGLVLLVRLREHAGALLADNILLLFIANLVFHLRLEDVHAQVLVRMLQRLLFHLCSVELLVNECGLFLPLLLQVLEVNRSLQL
jgi:hypothetical protein